MSENINRREFIKKTGEMGAVLVTASMLPLGWDAKMLEGLTPWAVSDIVVVKGGDPFQNTVKAIEAIGGMKAFVRKGDRVLILPNPQGRKPGVYTNKEVVRAVLRLCRQAGAKEVVISTIHGPGAWEKIGITGIVKEEGGVIQPAMGLNDYIELPVPRGKKLKKAKVVRAALENDVLISIPVIKHHNSSRFTGVMKNFMAFNMGNRYFHKEDMAHLDQCIVDLNTVMKVELCVVDATEILAENGPFGPGRTIKPQQVIVGTNRVAVDAYSCTLLGLTAKEVGAIKGGYEMGMGEMELDKLNIKILEV